MADAGSIFSGIMAWFWAIAFILISWYTIPPILNFLTDTTVKAVLWGGYIILVGYVGLVRPVQLMTQKKD